MDDSVGLMIINIIKIYLAMMILIFKRIIIKYKNSLFIKMI